MTFTPKEKQGIADRITQETPVLSPGSIAEFIGFAESYDADICQAIVAWAKTGVMPDTPVVAGYTPSRLNQDYFPTQVFGLMASMRRAGGPIDELRKTPGRQTAESEKLDGERYLT